MGKIDDYFLIKKYEILKEMGQSGKFLEGLNNHPT